MGDQLMIDRRKLLELGAAGTALGASSVFLPSLARAGSPESQQVNGDDAFLYFECHDVGEFDDGSFNDATKKTIVNDSYLAGSLRHIQGDWVFSSMTAGSSSPLSYSTYYAPIP